MPIISLCMIVKNEEKFLPDCLASVKGLVDEIIVVDTGSTDRTVEIAESFGAKVLHYKWDDDTANARNTGVKEAAGDWLLILDADETISKENFAQFRKLIESDEFDAYYLLQINYCNDSNDMRFVPLIGNHPEAKGFKGYFPVDIIRLFRNRKGVKFTSIVHERLNESVKENNLRIARTDFPINHYQYLKGEEEMKRKQLAFLHLFEKKVIEYPNDAKIHYDMAVIYSKYTSEKEKAIMHLKKALEISPNYFESLFSLGAIYDREGNAQAALECYIKAMEIKPSHAGVYYNIGTIFVRLKQIDKAREAFEESVKISPNNALAQNNLGNIYLMQKRLADALPCFKKAIGLNHSRAEELRKIVANIEEDLRKSNQ